MMELVDALQSGARMQEADKKIYQIKSVCLAYVLRIHTLVTICLFCYKTENNKFIVPHSVVTEFYVQ